MSELQPIHQTSHRSKPRQLSPARKGYLRYLTADSVSFVLRWPYDALTKSVGLTLATLGAFSSRSNPTGWFDHTGCAFIDPVSKRLSALQEKTLVRKVHRCAHELLLPPGTAPMDPATESLLREVCTWKLPKDAGVSAYVLKLILRILAALAEPHGRTVTISVRNLMCLASLPELTVRRGLHILEDAAILSCQRGLQNNRHATNTYQLRRLVGENFSSTSGHDGSVPSSQRDTPQPVSIRAQILDLLRSENRTLTTSEIATTLGVTCQQVKDASRPMAQKGIVEMNTRSREGVSLPNTLRLSMPKPKKPRTKWDLNSKQRTVVKKLALQLDGDPKGFANALDVAGFSWLAQSEHDTCLDAYNAKGKIAARLRDLQTRAKTW